MLLELSIATGKSRKTKVWENKKTTWTNLVKKLSQPKSTGETFKEYMSYSKDRQAEIKDRGGFVGGYLIEGKRSPRTVKYRQVLTLDIDLATKDFWEDFCFYYGCEAVLHSTHKHSKRSPRYRLIIPLNRKASAEEYEAIGRMLAGTLDINIFDPTTFQPERLMYWPTVAVDGVWIFEHQKGTLLDCDKVLSQYEDWSDVSAWPKPDSETAFIHKTLKQQGAPAEKPGVIGAFCRRYDIHEAITEFLPEIYEPTDFEDRYTFTEGSAAAGAIVYGEGEFLYSHHGTDPIHGQLCNSFDLVRLHKFGHEDKGGEEQEITKRRSYRLMSDFARTLPDVIREVGIARTSAADDFDDDFEIDPEYDNKWLGDLTLDKFGKYDNTIPNFLKILMNDPFLRGRFKYDKFNIREVIVYPVPWALEKDGFPKGDREFIDADDAGLRHYLENKYGIYNATKTKDAIDIIFKKNAFHPVTDYLDKLEWDGVPRLDSLIIDYLGAEDTDFVKLATRKAFTAAVARVYKPGIKFDYVLTLIGPEGLKKSTLLRKMAGDDWFSDTFMGIQGKEAYEQLHGVWLMEVGELAGIKRSEAEPIKLYFSKQDDKYRVAYGKRPMTFKRQVVFFATTNEHSFLKNNNGNRRFWPVKISGLGLGDIDEIPVDQIWAEAKTYFDKGERLYFDADIEQEAREIQRRHTESDEREGLITEFLDTPVPGNWSQMKMYERKSYFNDPEAIEECGEVLRKTICAAEIWCELFQSPLKDMGTHNTKYIHSIMENMPGWERCYYSTHYPIYGRQKGYRRKSYIAQQKRQEKRNLERPR